MLRIFTGTRVAGYRIGNWSWNAKTEKLIFSSQYEKLSAAETYIETAGYKFLKDINELEESIYRQEFQRDNITFDADVILIQDIKNLVLFLAPSEMVTKNFVHFINTKTVHRFLKALIIYFEHFLKIVEFLLIRRDELSQHMPRMQSEESIKIKQIYSAHLTQYRLLLAREYSQILLGEGTVNDVHNCKKNKFYTPDILAERAFQESFIAFCTQVVWIAMHRRNYDIIDMEIGRLFRSEHFRLQEEDVTKFSETERKLLYGKNYTHSNYRTQNSPIIQEITSVSMVDLPILWIGKQKYRGTDLRIHELEMEFLVPSSQLVLINKVHGILGHPKKLYNTLLQLNWNEVRKQHYSADYDPYSIVTQPRLRIPKLNEESIRKQSKQYEALFKIKQMHEYWDKAMVDKWIQRDKIIKYFNTKGIITDIIAKCRRSLEEKRETDVNLITQQFIARNEKLLKKF